MNNTIYKIKNLLFKLSSEGRKLKIPSYENLLKYQNFIKNNDNKFAISFGAGRSGQNWFSKIFNSHSNWIGTCERFADYESFYRYVRFYKLPINMDEFFRLIDLSAKRDMALYHNSFISSPYLSVGLKELVKKSNPDYIFFNIRNPINTIESLHKKGWYKNLDQNIVKSPSIDISVGQYRSFSRIIPNDDYIDSWNSLTRIGKITWYWSTINKLILDDFNLINDIQKFYIKLEDINQNYDIYENLAKRFNFKKKMTKNQFLNVINKASNKGSDNKHHYKNWNNLEKKEFENIINEIFPFYDKIKTNV
jgi:hypothetical protein